MITHTHATLMKRTLGECAEFLDRLPQARERFFGWGAKLNDFSVGEMKVGEKQSRQSNSKYNFVQYVFFEKGIRSVQCGLWQSLGNFPEFLYGKNWGAGCTSCSPNNLFRFPCSPSSPAYADY